MFIECIPILDKNMTFKKIAYQLHLWIGMISGIIAFIVCITGAIWALNIHGWVDRVKADEMPLPPTSAPLLAPSQLVKATQDTLDLTPAYVVYTKDAPAKLGSRGKKARFSVMMNPYTGKLMPGQQVNNNIQDGKDKFDFWNFIRQGHRSLWLPWNIGRPIVNYGTLAFALVLITGVIIWVPKTKNGWKNKTWFRWKKGTPLKRKLFDLHSILGVYICLVLLAIAFTGMVWGLNWWSSGLYKVTSGGKDLPEWEEVQSDTIHADTLMTPLIAVDHIFEKLNKENPKAQSISIYYPNAEEKGSTISVTVSADKDVYYNSDRYTFDRYSLKDISPKGPYSGKYKDASFGDKLRRMNYDIHIGTILGTPGKLIVFFSALFGASLPLTGFYIFYQLHMKKKKNNRKKMKA